MKKILATCFMLIIGSSLFSCWNIKAKNSLFANDIRFDEYLELSPIYYPKAVEYFDNLKIKYPKLKPVEILIWAGPMSDTNTIYFPMIWIEELEKGNKFFRNATEWVILHELGHIVHGDMYKIFKILFAGFAEVFNASLIISIAADLKKDSIHIAEFLVFTTAMATAMATGVKIFKYSYSLIMQEYLADDYAMDECNNPDAWIAAYELLDRKAPLGIYSGINHSFTKYRLSRIAKAFRDKFGYELVVVPQSLYPKYEVFS